MAPDRMPGRPQRQRRPKGFPVLAHDVGRSDPEEVAHATYGDDMACHLRSDLGTNASDMHVHRTGATAVLKAPHAVEKRLARIGTGGMRGQKAQERVLHEREVHGPVIDVDLIGCQVDGHVINRDDVGGSALLARPEQERAANLELGLVCRREDEVVLALHRHAHRGKLVEIAHDEHGDEAVLGDEGVDGIERLLLHAVCIENDKVKLMPRGDGLSEGLLVREGNRYVDCMGQLPHAIVQARGPRYEQDVLVMHPEIPLPMRFNAESIARAYKRMCSSQKKTNDTLTQRT